ncbi:MAG: bifunctional proline dehydrogenase/L-glutamate gamma-semialdehyde dehydrogenase PutA [Rhizobiales bacterium]|nr:bifunctional proline dehydrogenase/L-glutamate gamma-semialdehyde dehydrogenase PutA [Hyphomicrobiales bacterium]
MTQSDRSAIADRLFAEEAELVQTLAKEVALPSHARADVERIARTLVANVRANRRSQGSIDSFMQQFSLSSEEGVVLMCLAESLLRIPDAETADKLIADKIGEKDWEAHLGQSDSLFVNASAWGLMLTGRLVELGKSPGARGLASLRKLVSRSGEPIIRTAMKQAMRIMGKQFVLGRTIKEALETAEPLTREGWRFSFDMLGESAMTEPDAERYQAAYLKAVEAVGAGSKGADIFAAPSVSVKLSALHPRYEEKTRDRCLPDLYARMLDLAVAARKRNIGLTVDAEEAARLDISLELFGRLAAAPELKDWNGLGLAVQAYGRRARPVLEWLASLAGKTGRILPVRLVKGAYWDTEIKRAQEGGLESFPVFTRKVSTDVSYLACARYMLARRDVFFPQFATHNAQTVASIAVMAGNDKRYEFQRLHGMGQSLYEQVVKGGLIDQPCRIYAPVGSHEDLLAYLVRRLLENGANTSFVNRLADDDAPIAEIIADPVLEVQKLAQIPHPRILPPARLFGARENSAGLPTWHTPIREPLLDSIRLALAQQTSAAPIIGGKLQSGAAKPVLSPHDRSVRVGQVTETDPGDVGRAVSLAHGAQQAWDRQGGEVRAAILEKAARLYEQNRARLLGLLIREAGKTLDNAIADLREAVDFLRYYAERARADFQTPVAMPGPTGERNELSLHGRGVFACIAPWNFPLAIFTGQVAAALAAGNAAIAKPAEQTPLIAFEAVRLLHQAGVPADVLHFLPGDGASIGKVLLADRLLTGVAFTGSNATASIIAGALATRKGPIATLVAETGGMNAMIMDSSALPEQAVRDVVASAFDSAGQRCSAARILFVQDDVAAKVITMLRGAMAELVVGDPMNYVTDVGPVIDDEAMQKLEAHKARMAKEGKLIHACEMADETGRGTFVAPAAYELSSLAPLSEEVFGPVLHVVRYDGTRLDKVIDAINETGYGLTIGLHTRIEDVVDEVRSKARVGNLYVNRNQIGAVVGAQPFGGEGLSGTGPKAGGPHYLHRFAVERVMSWDTTASGGNAALMSMEGVAGE